MIIIFSYSWKFIIIYSPWSLPREPCAVGMPDQSVIRILHINDFHLFAEPYKSYGWDEMLGGISYQQKLGRAFPYQLRKPSCSTPAGN